MAINYTKVITEVKNHLQKANLKYKSYSNKKHRFKKFQPGELVMLHLCKEQFPLGTYSKLKPRKLGPFAILKKINDNAYAIKLQLDLHINPTFNISDIHQYYPANEMNVHVSNSYRVRITRCSSPFYSNYMFYIFLS